MIRAWLLVVALAGCDRVFGLSAGDAPGANAVIGSYDLRRLVGDPATGAPIVQHDIVPNTMLQITATLDDGTPADVHYDDTTGTFSFELARPGQAYRIRRVLDGGPEEFQLASPTLHLADNRAGRADAAGVTVPTPVTFDPGITVPSDFEVYTTGVFGIAAVGVAPEPFQIDWNALQPNNQHLLLTDASKGDRVYVVRLAQSASTPPYAAATSFFSAAATIANGVSETVNGTLATTSPICATITANRGDEDARLLAQLPAPETYSPYGGDWTMSAVAAPDLGPVFPLTIASQVESGTASNVTMPATFIDPFPGTTVMASTGVAHTRAISIAGALATPEPVGVQFFVPVSSTADCAANAVVASAPLGFVTLATIAGATVDTDGASVPIAGDATVAWTTDEPVDSTTVTLEEVAAMDGQTIVQGVAQYVTPANQVVIAGANLVSGRSYILRFDAQIGVPNATDGDYATMAYPFGNSTTWSRVFQVQ